MSRKSLLLSGLFCLVVLLALAVTQASAGGSAAAPVGGPAQTANALLTKAAGTAVVAATNLAGTAAAAATKVAPTLQAGATKLGPTAAAAGTRAARTATALWPTLQAGATNLGPTAAAAGTRAARTATALMPTLLAGATAVKGTATAVRGTVTPPATVSAQEASTAITTYASTVLGLSVSVSKAAGWTGAINKSLTQTSAGSSAQAATVKIAGKTYEALLKNGAASLSYGSGTISGDVTVDVQGSSLGVYSLVITGTTVIRTADAALVLAKAAFPALKDLAYISYAAPAGYAWYFKGTANGYDPKTKKVTALAEAVILYVAPAGKVANVSVTVGRGDFAAQLSLP